MLHKINGQNQTLQFEGELLAESSSYWRGSQRWVEFALYRTTAGTYVLSRVGQSAVFHLSGCYMIERYKLQPSDPTRLKERRDSGVMLLACDTCAADLVDKVDSLGPIYLEQPRYWAQACPTPDGVVESLYKEDASGIRYLTRVASRLLDKASEKDTALEAAYRVQVID